KYAPPVFGVVPAWSALLGVVGDCAPPEAVMMTVHGEQDMHFAQPLVPGMKIRTSGQPFTIRVAPSGARFTIRPRSIDDATNDLVIEQYVTMFIRGMTDGESVGPDKPDHTFADDAAARSNIIGDYSVHVDDDQTFRYRDASGDQMPIHIDDDFAKQ